MAIPEFNDEGDLPQGIYSATLRETLERFGGGSAQRRVVASRLERIYKLADSTG